MHTQHDPLGATRHTLEEHRGYNGARRVVGAGSEQFPEYQYAEYVVAFYAYDRYRGTTRHARNYIVPYRATE